MTEGESHVPKVKGDKGLEWKLKLKEIIGVESFSILYIINIALIGWPLYLITGATGGPGIFILNIFFFIF